MKIDYLNRSVRVSSKQLSPVKDKGSSSPIAAATSLKDLRMNTRHMLLLPRKKKKQIRGLMMNTDQINASHSPVIIFQGSVSCSWTVNERFLMQLSSAIL